MSRPIAPPALHEVDREGKTWRILEAYAQARIAGLHRTLETVQPEANTQFLRGQLAEIRSMLNAAKPASVGIPQNPVPQNTRQY